MRAAFRGYHWPGLLDLMTSTLMVFVFVSFLQTTLVVDVEDLLTRQEQDRFRVWFEEAFSREMAAKTVSVRRFPNFLQLTFTDHVLFASGQHELQPSGRQLLAKCASILQAANVTGYEQVQVEGHTDSLPLERTTYPHDNWELSTARALSVVQHLIAQGLPARVLSANGYAEYRPVASNESITGRAQNRRIEIRLFFSVGSARLEEER